MQSNSAIPNQKEGEFAYLWRELRRRTVEFPNRFSFIVYVLVAIVGLGGLGIWTELVNLALSDNRDDALDDLFIAATTYYPAVAGSATFQLIMIATGNTDRVMTSFGFLAMFLFTVAALLSTVLRALCPFASLALAPILAAASIWVWIVANADNPIYKPVPVDAPSGGNPSRDPKGDLSDFVVD